MLSCWVRDCSPSSNGFHGAGSLTGFNVWSYQVDPEEVRVGDPVDLSKRLCGTTEIRFPVSHDTGHGTSLVSGND